MNIRAVFLAMLLLWANAARGENPSVLILQNVNGHLRHSREGIDGRASDGRRLFLNTLRWLAEPSMRARGKGGLEHDSSLEESEDMPPVPPAADWSKFQFKDRPSLRGVIGAQSAYSSGEGTVSEWKAAAREAGLDFLVFLEAFDELSPDGLESLKRDCRRLSDETILLVPGFASRNFIGMKN